MIKVAEDFLQLWNRLSSSVQGIFKWVSGCFYWKFTGQLASGVYILHKIYFFYPSTNFFYYFSPPIFFSPSRGENGKIFKDLYILFILSLLPHLFFSFFTKEGGGGGDGKNVFSFKKFLNFFHYNKIFFIFYKFFIFFSHKPFFFYPPPPPPPQQGIPCRIYTPNQLFPDFPNISPYLKCFWSN